MTCKKDSCVLCLATTKDNSVKFIHANAITFCSGACSNFKIAESHGEEVFSDSISSIMEKTSISFNQKSRIFDDYIKVTFGDFEYSWKHKIGAFSKSKGLFSETYRTEKEHNIMSNVVTRWFFDGEGGEAVLMIQIKGNYDEKKMDFRYDVYHGGYLLECDGNGITSEILLHVGEPKNGNKPFEDSRYIVRSNKLFKENAFIEICGKGNNKIRISLNETTINANTNPTQTDTNTYPHLLKYLIQTRNMWESNSLLCGDITRLFPDITSSGRNNNNNNNNIVELDHNVNNMPPPTPVYPSNHNIVNFNDNFNNTANYKSPSPILNNTLNENDMFAETLFDDSSSLLLPPPRPVNSSEDPNAPPKKRQRTH